ncbi:hypothetical protein GCM10010094_42630 [Streptomyces flaveus]|uniref:Uncharacterized protein n=1 Tax=Streptomyces flaveus TaxID=66370 RepID=A0A917QZ97_9ACTN|nr:hypothetical protein GCM10010094_42630 [Streptomyces flaveus]
MEAANSGGLCAVAQMRLGDSTGQALGAVGDAFLDGLRLCLIVAAALTLLAALVSVILLRRPRRATSRMRPLGSQTITHPARTLSKPAGHLSRQ